MAAVFTKKVRCLSLSKFCGSAMSVGVSRSSGTTAVDYDERTASISSSNEEREHHHKQQHGTAARLRRLQESAAGSVRRTRTHSDTIIRERGIALLRNPQTNKVSDT